MPGVWASCQWCEDAEIALQGIAGNPDRARADIESGRRELFRVSGDDYAGWLVTEMRRFDGGLVLHVDAFAGRGIESAFRDLIEIARGVGCVAVTCQSEKPAAWRLFQRIGWRETARFFEVKIDGQ
jgi:hypothetical protein